MKAMLIALLAASFAHADDKNKPVTLYQVGKAGNYCLSITPNERGCVSGSKVDGSTVNILNFIKGRNVVFENLSDAPHDMKFTGANAEEMAAQMPNAGAVQKNMAMEDLLKQKITCNFHGAQLAVGFSVLGGGDFNPISALFSGHSSRVGGDAGNPLAGAGPAGQLANLGPTGVGYVSTTGLADVSKTILAKGSASEVASLLTVRPDLMTDLKNIRPLLAGEIAQAAADGKLINGAALPEGLADQTLIRTGVGLAAADNWGAPTGGAKGVSFPGGAAAGANGAGGKLAANGRTGNAGAIGLFANGSRVGGGNGAGDESLEGDEANPSDGALVANRRFAASGATRVKRSRMSAQGDEWSLLNLPGKAADHWLLILLLVAVATVVRAMRKRARVPVVPLRRREREEPRVANAAVAGRAAAR